MLAQQHRAFVECRASWQAFVGSCMMNRVLRRQRHMVFFHAASLGVHGAGILVTGAKGAGKSTLALSLAARGHHFLGDEMAALHYPSRALLPFRRAASVRPGPRARAVASRLCGGTYASETYPDGTVRLRAQVGELFPQAASTAMPLRCAIFLRRFAPRPQVEAFRFSRPHLQLLQPLSGTLWDVPPGRQLLMLLEVFTRIPCYFLDAGEPDATADVIEHLMGAL